ncbi:MAG: DUF697 domain-containing protein [Caldilineae bacterium]|nr:MAG: DUF697 domain-containing protein [Caldilineae bacterium]
MSDSLKKQAEEIFVAVERELQDEKTAAAERSRLEGLLDALLKVAHNVDIAAAAERVAQLRQQYPRASTGKLAQRLIRDKCRQTATVGAATSGAGLIPGVGTAAAVILGTAADISATFRLQAELVLEMAHLYNYPLTEREKHTLVLLITGLSAGAGAMARRAGQRAGVKLGEMFAEKSILKALPVVGVLASAGTNVLSTYLIGRRAEAYFRLGEAGLQSWEESLRALTGVDERKIGRWLSARGRTAGRALSETAEIAGTVGQSAWRGYLGLVKRFWKGGFRRLAIDD